MFKKNLKLLIETSGTIQKDLATFVNVKPNTVSDWIKQGNSPKVEHLCRISEFFNVSLDWLITGNGEMYRNVKNADALDIKLINGVKKLDEKEKELVLERIQTLLELKEVSEKVTKQEKIIKPVAIKKAADLYEEENATIDMIVYDLAASAGLGNYLFEVSTYEVLNFDTDKVADGADYGIRIIGNSMEPKISDGSIVWVKEQIQIENNQIGIFILNDEEAFCKKLFIDHENRAVYLVSLNPKYKPIKIKESDFLRTVGRVIY